MTAEIVEFPKSRTPSTPSDLDEIQKRNEAERNDLVQRVRSAAADPKAKFERDGEIAPAQAIDRLIAEAKSRKITQSEIEKAISKARGKSVHLERLKVDHEKLPSDVAKNKLRGKKIQPYVVALDVIAEKLGKIPDHVIFDTFRDSKFRGSPGFRPDFSVDDPAASLSWLLHKMAESVIRSESLGNYFEEIQREHAGYDGSTEEFVRDSVHPRWLQAYEDSLDMATSRRPIPAVPLIRVHRATFIGPLDVEKKPVGGSDEPRSEVAARFQAFRKESGALGPEFSKYVDGEQPQRKYRGHVFGPIETVAAQIRLFTDIRLAVAPRTRTDDLGPLFEVFTHVELRTGGLLRQLTFDLSSFPLSARADAYCEMQDFVGSVAARFDDGWRRITGFGKLGWKLVGGEYSYGTDPASPAGPLERDPKWFGLTLDAGIRFEPLLGTEGSSDGEWATYCLPVNPVTVGHLIQLLSKPVDWGRWPGPVEGRRWQWLCQTTGPYAKPELFLFFDESCREFETALHTGAIETTLAADCHHLRQKLDESLSRTTAQLEQQTASLLARWRSASERHNSISDNVLGGEK